MLFAAMAVGSGLRHVEATRARLVPVERAAEQAAALLAGLHEAEAGQRGFLLTGGRDRYLNDQALPAIG
ncbi:MAG TPA: hypothetical protein VE033_17565, partial [Acetobacteraceae bacterium]|nr:hypothetical protein [Acetobacteraceae bacterium]